ncbi:heterokaryon incompatibility protein-domain-containing protein [Lasiosphaeria hispida]|uniref:Heterokaryon incompatibility protein-domain-containing protein n=1 Tax=Lasiosphaeria hispida TaxID=260671 RepID=A0AAJ0MES5_9PEZI|nr:heterokaryon incompatibility protein-domain-containing protein [Lasiosphaeria hispida]
MTTFQYSPLRDFTSSSPPANRPTQIVHGAWELRLIRLQPSKTTDSPIQCALFHTLFSEAKRSYEALSYVWADDTGIPANEIPSPCEIAVDGTPFPVTLNLYAALQRLRGRGDDGADRVLWTDQICINQDDTAEKNWQVDRMGLIYGYAKQTTIWLGGEADGSFRALFLVSGLAAVSRLPGTQYERVAAAVGGYSDRARWEALGKLMERRWWRRTWTVQECVLPRLGSLVVRCGVKEIPWTDFVAAVRLMDGLREVMPLCVGLVSIASMRELQLGRRRAAARGEEKGDGNGLDSLLEALARYRTRLATDPRDKVYAIMRMARDFRDASDAGPRLLRVDYSKPAEEVYFDTARFLVETGKTLEFLGHCRLTKNLDSLPSWVPDWSDSSSYPRPFSFCRGPTADLEGTSNFHLSGTGLVVKGNRLGSVDILGEPCFEEHVSPMKAPPLFFAWRAILTNYLAATDTPEEVLEEYFVRVLVADRGARQEPLDRASRDELIDAYRLWSGQTPATKHDTDEWLVSEAMKVVGFMGSVRRACVSRRIFVSQQGFIGLAPRETSEGDFIVSSLTDGRLYLVLRQISMMGCLLVGTCFIHDSARIPGLTTEIENYTLV